MRILVTGGTGFLGNSIVEFLLNEGHEVHSYNRGVNPNKGREGLTHFQGDLSDSKRLKEAMIGCEAVFHVGAKLGFWGLYGEFYRTNVLGTENVLNACRELGIRYLVYTSTPSVVFDGKDSEGKNESLPYPKKFNSFYPQTKALAERMVLAANCEVLKTVSLRPPLIWGPGDRQLFPTLLEKAKRGTLRIVGNGKNLVDCIFIDNAAKAHLQVLRQLILDSSQVDGKAYFISQDNPIPMSKFINDLIASANYPPVDKHVSPMLAKTAAIILEALYSTFGIAAEPPISLFLVQQLSVTRWYDISAAKKDFGFEPEITIEKGMKMLNDWYSIKKA